MLEILGFIAGALNVAALMPQVLKSWRTKSTHDLSIGWITVSFTAQVLWVIYGLQIGSLSLVIATIATMFLTLSLFYLKLRHG